MSSFNPLSFTLVYNTLHTYGLSLSQRLCSCTSCLLTTWKCVPLVDLPPTPDTLYWRCSHHPAPQSPLSFHLGYGTPQSYLHYFLNMRKLDFFKTWFMVKNVDTSMITQTSFWLAAVEPCGTLSYTAAHPMHPQHFWLQQYFFTTLTDVSQKALCGVLATHTDTQISSMVIFCPAFQH